MKPLKKNNKLASLLLRIGLASVLLYASIASISNPVEWVGYLPHFLVTRFPGNTLVYPFSAYEAALAIWLLSGIYIRYAALLATMTFLGILFTNIGAFSTVTFRDVTMVFTALALIFLDDKDK